MKCRFSPLAVILFFLAISGSPGDIQSLGNASLDECDSTFVNPVMDGAGPWVIKKDGYYYFCETRDGGIYVSKSEKLTELKNWKQVWQQPDEGWTRESNRLFCLLLF